MSELLSVRNLTLVGYGSQGRAWAHNLRDAGWELTILVRSESSQSRASNDGFKTQLIDTWRPSNTPELVALLLPDLEIARFYTQTLSRFGDHRIILVIAHGLAVHAGWLNPTTTNHSTVLLAPKAIGPKLREAFVASPTHQHQLTCAADFSQLRDKDAELKLVQELASGLGFQSKGIVHTSFSKETIGDLVSEQLLLCGGIFTLLEETMLRMERLGLDPRLIHEECITELKLIADMIAEQGLTRTRSKISVAARVGAENFNSRLKALPGFLELLDSQVTAITDGSFSRNLGATLQSKETP